MSRSTLTDEQVAQIRALHAEGGLSLQRIAVRFGTTRQHVHRIVRGEQRQTLPVVGAVEAGSVVAAVRATLEAGGFDAGADHQAATALVLAEKLDAVRRAETAQSAMAAPGLVRELNVTLAALWESEGDVGPRLGSTRGEEARLLASAIGFPDPEHVDVADWNWLSALQLDMVRRQSGLPPQVALHEMLRRERRPGLPERPSRWELGEDGWPRWRDTSFAGGRGC